MLLSIWKSDACLHYPYKMPKDPHRKNLGRFHKNTKLNGTWNVGIYSIAHYEISIGSKK